MQIIHVIKFAFSTKVYILLMLQRVKTKLHSSDSYLPGCVYGLYIQPSDLFKQKQSHY